MDGLTFSLMGSIHSGGFPWIVATHAGDFDDDGKADLIWHNGASDETRDVAHGRWVAQVAHGLGDPRERRLERDCTSRTSTATAGRTCCGDTTLQARWRSG